MILIYTRLFNQLKFIKHYKQETKKSRIPKIESMTVLNYSGSSSQCGLGWESLRPFQGSLLRSKLFS